MSDLAETLRVSDMYALPGLKQICVSDIPKHITASNVLDVWKLACEMDLSRLKDDCLKFMADNIYQVSI